MKLPLTTNQLIGIFLLLATSVYADCTRLFLQPSKFESILLATCCFELNFHVCNHLKYERTIKRVLYTFSANVLPKTAILIMLMYRIAQDDNFRECLFVNLSKKHKSGLKNIILALKLLHFKSAWPSFVSKTFPINIVYTRETCLVVLYFFFCIFNYCWLEFAFNIFVLISVQKLLRLLYYFKLTFPIDCKIGPNTDKQLYNHLLRYCHQEPNVYNNLIKKKGILKLNERNSTVSVLFKKKLPKELCLKIAEFETQHFDSKLFYDENIWFPKKKK